MLFTAGFTIRPENVSGTRFLDTPITATPTPDPTIIVGESGGGTVSNPNLDSQPVEVRRNETQVFTGEQSKNLLASSFSPSFAGWQNILVEDFEYNFPSNEWKLEDGHYPGRYLWGASEFMPHSGNLSAWPAKGGYYGHDPVDPSYPNNCDSWLIYGPFNLSNANDAELLFYYWNSTEVGPDYFFWGASIDGANFYGSTVSGDSKGWVAENFDLTNVYTLGNLVGNSQVWIAFRFYSDFGTNDYYGTFIDDIVLQKYVQPVLSGGFGKISPAYGVKQQPINPTLSWGASSGATSYEYCISTTSPCTSWTNIGNTTSVALNGLSWDTRYYWNVVAINDAGTTYSDGMTPDWLFRTMAKPVPALTSLSPAYTLVNSSNLTLTINGTGFVNGDTASWNGVPLTTTFVSSTQLTASVNSADLTTISTAQITVTDPDLVVSNALPFSIHTFADAVPTSWYWRYVEGFYAKGITTGCDTGPLRYCPDRAVTRAEMAVFVLRSQHADALPYTPNPDPSVVGAFADVPFSGKEWMQPWIEEFYQSGMTTGCNTNPLRYCPERQVTRAEMAVFVLRAVHGKDYVPPTATGVFSDVPVSGKEWMQPWIEQFYREGITTGCAQSPLRYCPEQPVTRAEMATFLDRAFGFPLLP